MTSEYIAPLNLKYILINTLAGSPTVFMFLFGIALGTLAAIFKMPDKTFLLMVALAAILLQGIWISGGFYFLALIVGGLFSFWAISRIVKN